MNYYLLSEIQKIAESNKQEELRKDIESKLNSFNVNVLKGNDK